ncbi:MAG: aspartate kinase [Candidatus Bathyarchaeia archaeon]
MTTFTVSATGSTTPQTLSSKISAPTILQTVIAASPRASSKQKTRRIVVKFGGSSLADKDRIAKAARLVFKETAKGTRLVVVVSAIGKMTDQLIGLVNHDSTKAPDKTDLDDVLAMGERTSVRIFATALKSEGLEARYFDPTDADWPIITDDDFSNANPILELCLQKVREHVVPLLDLGTVPVIAGFVGRSTGGKISTIGRGGSDTTAFIIAKAIGADEVVLVTDADGILTADPKIIPNARKLARIEVRTLVGLADSGTKFIHRKALKYKDPDIPVKVINHNKDDLEADGTIITGGISGEIEVTFASSTPAMAITITGKAISENPEILANVVREIRQHSMLDGLSANFDSVIFYVPQTPQTLLLKNVHDLLIGCSETLAMAVQRNLAFLKVKGVGLEDTPGIIGRISQRLREKEINIFGMLTLASSILVFVSWDERETALNLMRQVVRGEL